METFFWESVQISITHGILHVVLILDFISLIEEPEVHEDHYIFPCPVYRTQIREGEILPTGHSTNFIFELGMVLNMALSAKVRLENGWISKQMV